MTNRMQFEIESIPLAIRVSTLVGGGVRSINRLADDQARAQRAVALAGLPRQRLSELRALYHDTATEELAARAAR